MTVLADPPVDSARGRQMTALLAAAHLAEHSLPEVAYWEVTADGRLRIQTRAAMSVAGDLAAIHAWATFLGADMQVHDGFRGATRLVVTATYRTASVEAWTTVHLPGLTATQGDTDV